MRKARNTEMPNLFVIGAMKSGTTSLHRYLDLHPEVSMSLEKEPAYFAVDPGPSVRLVIRDRDTYLGLFKAGTMIRGEASTAYSRYPEITGVPEAIAARVPDAKIIYLVRDPISRLHAEVRERMANRPRHLRHLPADAPIEEIIGNLDDPVNRFLCAGRYMTQVRQYLSCFPEESLLVVDSDDLRVERRKTMSRIFEFLGVESDFWDDRMEVEQNRGSVKRRQSDLYVRLSNIATLKAAVDRMSPRVKRDAIRLLRSTLARSWEPPSLDADLRERLIELYRPEVLELREFTGQDFAGWSI